MSLYAVKNDKGEWWDFEAYDGFWSDGSCECAVTAYQERADSAVKEHGGHVVELFEAPAKVVVSEEEAEMLKKAKNMINPMHLLWMNELTYNGDSDGQDRLMRAYVLGWTVEKPKLFLVKVPHTDDSYFYKIDDEYCNAGDSYHLEGMTDKKWFTLAEIEHYELTDCERVKVTDDEQ